MALSVTEIKRIEATIAQADPKYREMLEGLLARAKESPPRSTGAVLFVEVTSADGVATIMAAKDYQRLTALDLAHTKLRMLPADEVARRKLG